LARVARSEWASASAAIGAGIDNKTSSGLSHSGSVGELIGKHWSHDDGNTRSQGAERGTRPAVANSQVSHSEHVGLINPWLDVNVVRYF
jgi:hypothetical protein